MPGSESIRWAHKTKTIQNGSTDQPLCQGRKWSVYSVSQCSQGVDFQLSVQSMYSSLTRWTKNRPGLNISIWKELKYIYMERASLFLRRFPPPKKFLQILELSRLFRVCPGSREPLFTLAIVTKVTSKCRTNRYKWQAVQCKGQITGQDV